MQHQHVLIAGAGHAGGRVAQALRVAGHTGLITLVGDEPHPPYERPALSKEVLQGKKTAAELTLEPASFWHEGDNLQWRSHGIAAVCADRVAMLGNGERLAFDVLVVASGGAPRALTVAGSDLPGVRMLRTIDDCHALQPAFASGKHVVVIGGGVIGMEVAASAARMALNVTVLEGGARVMARCLPPEASAWLQKLHADNGVSIRIGTTVESIQRNHGGMLVNLSSGGHLPADIVLVAIGITPATGFLKGSGIALENGVLTDAFCRSSNTPWCYAVGDVANSFSPLYQRHVRQETWRNAENQARAVAASVMGRDVAYEELPWMWSDQFDRNIQVVGIHAPGDISVARAPLGEGAGSMLWLHEGKVAGGVLVDCGRERKQLEALVRRGSQIDVARLGDSTVSLKELATA
ncbi:NAD(P)/FAD-dependent oxidoreductase [Herbaspirillum sp. alder98]|uniref:NAD(P)/FAD-dependent oxidoreductase n=1 Tax=Herbaspirillum sp. alder98 TaxID=2913096 RepID=UPI001CD830E3|nr:FAD-dependent oxidoreductase [Herbaspirillum sp. alder98]MCA1326865.1 FAD-dependent oxidoreductase [Herbaspirillum sp. alder98]